MAESKDETAAVLELLKTSDEPSSADAARVRAAVWARIGLAGAVTTAAATGVHSLGHGAGASNVAATGSNALNVAGTLSSSLGAGAATGAKAAWVVTVAKVGLAVTLLGAGGWYGARALAPVTGSQLAGAAAPGDPVSSKAQAEPARALLVTPRSVAPPGREETSVAQTASRPRAAASTDTLDTEVALLGEAQRALAAGQYSVALASLDKHAARFPRGALSRERDASRAIALCRSGALSRGQKLAERYVAQHASSPLCTRVRAACKLTE